MGEWDSDVQSAGSVAHRGRGFVDGADDPLQQLKMEPSTMEEVEARLRDGLALIDSLHEAKQYMDINWNTQRL